MLADANFKKSRVRTQQRWQIYASELTIRARLITIVCCSKSKEQPIRTEETPDKVFAISPSYGDNQSVDRIITDLAVERFELPVRRARNVGYVLGGFLLLIFIWSAFAPVNVIAKGPGQLQPYGRPKLVQSQLDGQINQLSVREGSHVKKGDPLVTLDSAIFHEQLDEAQMKLKTGQTKLEQIKQAKEALSKVIKDPAVLPVTVMDLGDVADVVNQVYISHKQLDESKYDAAIGSGKQADDNTSEMTDLKNMKTQLTSESSENLRQVALQKQQLKDGEAQKQAEISGLVEQISSHKEMLKELQEMLAIAKEQQKDYADVLDLGVSRVQYLNISEKVAENARKVRSEKTTILELENRLKVAKLELPRWKAESQSKLSGLAAGLEQVRANIEDVNVRMRKNKRELNTEESTYGAALEKAKAALARQTGEFESQSAQVKALEDTVKISSKNMDKSIIRAPLTGVVSGLLVRGAGEVVKPGQELMKLLPDQTELVVAARIPNRDIGFVSVGQDVKIKLDAFPFQDFGVLPGKVSDIERYPEKDETRGYAYTVWIRPQQTHITASGKRLPLRSGLSGDCEIVVRRVSVLRALLSPIAKLSDVSMKD